MKRIKIDRGGFTLVELAIVMVIIGLLIGGVLKGQELVTNAKVTATLSQIRAYQSAVISFQDTYRALPGDIANALVVLPGCTAAISCANGNGNTLVDNPGGNPGGVATWNALVNTGEPLQFWKHLSLAGLITGVNQAAVPANIAFNVTHPSSQLRGGFEAYHDNNFSSDTPPIGPVDSGLILRLSQTGLAGAPTGATGAEAITPSEALSIDLKMDDGLPGAGIVFGAGAGCRAAAAGAGGAGGAPAAAAGAVAVGGANYNAAASRTRDCLLYIKIDS